MHSLARGFIEQHTDGKSTEHSEVAQLGQLKPHQESKQTPFRKGKREKFSKHLKSSSQEARERELELYSMGGPGYLSHRKEPEEQINDQGGNRATWTEEESWPSPETLSGMIPI